MENKMNNTIEYKDSTEGILPEMLSGFFVGWSNPPSAEMHLEILNRSTFIVLAIADNRVVGFLTAISDGVFAAYIPLLEVLPNYQNQGIGKELVKRIVKTLEKIYMVDLTCDPELQEFYKKIGFTKSTGMMIRNYEYQNGNKI